MRPGLSYLEGAAVWGNADYLKQIFLISLDNALKYTPAPCSVRLGAELRQESVVVRISDTGIGIAAAHLPRIFDRFYRAGNAHGSRGMGLGLDVARRLVEQHAGRIEVESAVGHGSHFTVALPLLNAASLREDVSTGDQVPRRQE
jgi:signal transduction histidine kinase